jgi:hypothetical protein
MSYRRVLIIVDNVPPEPIRTAPHDVARAVHVHDLAVRTCSVNWPVQHNLGGVAADEHMAHICLQRQAELDIVLGYGRELGAISDGSPVVLTNTASGAYKAIIASIFPELNRLSRAGITLSRSVTSGKFSDIRGLLFSAGRVSMRFANVAVIDRGARMFPIAGAYSFHSGRELCRDGVHRHS